MALAHSPKIATDGLVFAYDMGNTQKSWKGAPTTNFITTLGNPTLEYPSGEFGQYFNLVSIFETYGLVPYSLSFDAKANIPGYMKVYMQNGSYTKYGFIDQDITLSTQWQRFKFQNLTPSGPTAAWQTNSPGDNRAMLATYTIYGSGRNPVLKNFQLELGSFATPFVNGTRTNTQAVVDLMGTNVLTASNLTYNANGTFSFNNTSSVITMPDNPALNPTTALSIEAWVKFNGDSDDFIFEKGDVNSQYSLFSHSSDIVFRTFHSVDGTYHTQNPAKSSIGVVNGVPVHIFCSWDGSTKRIYINGVLKDSVAKTGVLITRTTGAAIGRFGGTSTGYYFGGDIYKVAVYNKALSEVEVQQNFNSLRGRYGV